MTTNSNFGQGAVQFGGNSSEGASAQAFAAETRTAVEGLVRAAAEGSSESAASEKDAPGANAAIVPVEQGNKTDAGLAAALYGQNGERLPQRIQAALRRLVVQFATESDHSRRQEIRRIKQAHQFWRGLQYGGARAIKIGICRLSRSWRTTRRWRICRAMNL
jgi:hypothetical protein